VLPLKLPNNFRCKWFFSSSPLDTRLGKNARPYVLLCGPILVGLVLSLVKGGAKGVSTLAIAKEGDRHVEAPFPSNFAPKRIRKKEWELNQVFQDTWATKLLKVEVVIGEDGRLSMIRCKVCSVMEHCEKLFVPKLDGLQKHVGHIERPSMHILGCMWGSIS
jgi:hypothetical protein